MDPMCCNCKVMETFHLHQTSKKNSPFIYVYKENPHEICCIVFGIIWGLMET